MATLGLFSNPFFPYSVWSAVQLISWDLLTSLVFYWYLWFWFKAWINSTKGVPEFILPWQHLLLSQTAPERENYFLYKGRFFHSTCLFGSHAMSDGVQFPWFSQQIRKMDSISVSGLCGKILVVERQNTWLSVRSCQRLPLCLIDSMPADPRQTHHWPKPRLSVMVAVPLG